MTVEGVLLAFLIYTLVLAVAGWWLWGQLSQRLVDLDSACELRHESVQMAVLDRASAAHVHEYAPAEHDHPHDHPHNHEHVQHTHTLEKMSEHEEGGRKVEVKFCAVCRTIFRDKAA